MACVYELSDMYVHVINVYTDKFYAQNIHVINIELCIRVSCIYRVVRNVVANARELVGRLTMRRVLHHFAIVNELLIIKNRSAEFNLQATGQ